MDYLSAETNRVQTLFQYLIRDNPVLNSASLKSGGNTNTVKLNYFMPARIQVWEDFNLNTLKQTYAYALKLCLQTNSHPHSDTSIPQYPFCEIHDEDSLESLLVKWTQSVVSDALAVYQTSPMAHYSTDPRIFMVKGGQADYCGSRSKYRPDWAGVYRSSISRASRPPNILPGETKLSSKWNSYDIQTGWLADLDIERSEVCTKDREEKKDGEKGKKNLPEWLKPLRQIFTYCLRCQVRYGYIITDQELVVLRLRAGPEHESFSARHEHRKVQGKDDKSSFELTAGPMVLRAKDYGILEYKAIPWQPQKNLLSQDTEHLTVNLALWWLHLMASQDTDIDEFYTPLGDLAETPDYGGPPTTGYSDPNASFASDASRVRRYFADVMHGPYDEYGEELPSPPIERPKNKKRSLGKTDKSYQREKRARGGDHKGKHKKR